MGSVIRRKGVAGGKGERERGKGGATSHLSQGLLI